MIAWEEPLIKELASRRCLIFLGAGASAGCISATGASSPPNWENLLIALSGKLPKTHTDLPLINLLIQEKRFLDAAEVIHNALSHPTYVATMRSIFDAPKYQPSRIHESVLEIDPKIVITTNFDTVYDLYCRTGEAAHGYNVFKYHEDHLVSDLRTPIRCVIKAHGCITNPDKMVLTKAQFFQARQNSQHFFKVLDSLFLTHTILFIGYGLSDPDIQLTLENANISATSSNKHYFVTGSGTHPALKKAAEDTYNIQFIEYANGNYTQLEDSLDQLAKLVAIDRAQNPMA
ncbi:SIR2 family protein [Pseudoxanthomonas winnipegensis]|jgi:hypothetical protein|uniref:Uncharacterized protein n=1 Tax=Pseudoxanthomonas winnipegensis TaxID=2480810 RepID=A0A4Q8LBS4_9GAMM|nr:SIR2 family protein [Pseudoxanthomonas winnipegensis]TAA25799.1 hypothetical protein EA660_10230 [Pseudoxanthomonas winnipegensis]